MPNLFISYARENKPDVDQVVEHLGDLGYETWFDSSLRGGQDWWEEILRRITNCDVFIAVVSRDALDSAACRHEFEWAEALGKPILPIAVEPLSPTELPRRFATRQIIDYSDPRSRDRAAVRLGGSLSALPPAQALPEPLPEPPETPLSYLTGLVDLVADRNGLNHEQQRQILTDLEPALSSVDPQERRSGREILARFSRRKDLFADVDRTIARLKAQAEEPRAARAKRSRFALLTGRTKIMLAGGAAAVVALVAIFVIIEPTSVKVDATADANHPVTISGNDQTRSAACDNGSVTIKGNNNTLSVSGHCTGLYVYGDMNKVTLNSADGLFVVGYWNIVRWRTGSPTTTSVETGESNTVEPLGR